MGFYVDNEINLYSGYGADRTYNMPYMSIKNSHQPFLESLSKKLSERNYHDFEDELRSIISSYDDNFAKTIEGSSVVYRARVGTAGYKVAFQEFSSEGKKIFVPFKDKEIGAVPSLRATSGRANRVGVSYLYLYRDCGSSTASNRCFDQFFHQMTCISLVRAVAADVLRFPSPRSPRSGGG